MLAVNRNTMLREEGLLEFRRGRGITVAGIPQRGAALAGARELVRLTRQHGYRRYELIQLTQACLVRRTAVVQLLFLWLLPSQSLSRQVVFAGRFHGGYRIWYVAR